MHRRRFLHITASAGMFVALDALAVACGDDGPTSSTDSSATTDGRPDVTTTPEVTTTEVTTTTEITTPEVTTTTEGPVEVTRYGPLSATPDDNGLLLPAGFTSELLAVGGETVTGTSYRWHPFPDGGACFALDAGGWVYANNSEVFVDGAGGAGALRFDAEGRVVDAYSVLEGTTNNCAGGATPWGTWLSCEEIPAGRVWECDPLGREPAEPRPAMGLFRHEAVAADATRQVLYLSEDEPDGLLYRFRPRTWGDLSEGVLEALAVSPVDGSTSWVPVLGLGEPGRTPTRYDAPGATPFPGGEGLAIDGDDLYLATKGDNRISRLDLAQSRLTLYWEGPPLWGPDNLAIQVSTGNLFVCEDGDNMEVVIVTPDGHADPFLRFVGQDGSEVTGAAFDPTGTRFIVNSQRAPTPTTFDELIDGEVSWPLGRTYMISGPF
jgi:hypothetical protein